MAPPIETVPSQWQPAVPVGTSDGWPRPFSGLSVGAEPRNRHRRRLRRPRRLAVGCAGPARGVRKRRNWSRNGSLVTIKHVGGAQSSPSARKPGPFERRRPDATEMARFDRRAISVVPAPSEPEPQDVALEPAGRGPLSRTSGRRAPRSRALASWSGARRDGRALRANALALQRFATPLACRGALRLVQGSNRTALAAKS